MILNRTSNTTIKKHSAIRIISLLAAGLFFAYSIQAQPAPRKHTGLQVSGNIPDDFRMSYSNLCRKGSQHLKGYEFGIDIDDKEVEESSYLVYKLITEGYVLYGDPVTNMLERIADTLLRDYPRLREELHFYTVKSSEMNAIATHQGMMLFNLGLIAKIEDESQLAYLMAHEIAHYYLKHPFDEQWHKTTGEKDEQQRLSDFMRYHHRSNAIEAEADSIAMVLFYNKSPYTKEVDLFDILAHSDYGLDEIPFDSAQFGNQWYFPSYSASAAYSKPNPSRLSNADLERRRQSAKRLLQQAVGHRRFVALAPRSFDSIRMAAQMECVRQDLIHGEYVKAFYNGGVVAQRYPHYDFGEKAQAQAIYMMSKQRTYNNSTLAPSGPCQGAIVAYYDFFRHIRRDDLALSAERYLWIKSIRHPHDHDYLAMASDIMHDIREQHQLGIDFFDTATHNIPTLWERKRTPRTQAFREKTASPQQEDTRPYAFVDFIAKSPTFNAILRHPTSYRQWAEDNPHTFDIDSNSLITIIPQYLIFGKNDSLKLSTTINRQERLQRDVVTASEVLGHKCIDFSPVTLRKHTDESFMRDYMALCEWKAEYYPTNGSFDFFSVTGHKTKEIAKKYKAGRIVYSSVLNSPNNERTPKPAYSYAALAIPPYTPVGLYHLTDHTQTTITRNTIVDIDRMTHLTNIEKRHDYNDAKSLVINDIYNALRQSDAEQTAKKTSAPSSGRLPVGGYIGQRFTLTAQCGLSFPILGAIFGTKSTPALLPRGGVNFEYTIGELWTISLGADYYKSICSMPTHEENTTTKTATVNLSARHYESHANAPLGVYWGVGAYASLLNATPAENLHIDKHIFHWGFTFETGRHYIIYQHLLMDLGVRYAITIANPFVGDQNSHAENRTVNANIWIKNLFMPYIGLGWVF